MFVVHTNLLAYAADRDAPGDERRRGLLLAWRARPEPAALMAEHGVRILYTCDIGLSSSGNLPF